MKRFLVLALLAFFALAAFSSAPVGAESRVAVIFSIGGLGDESFNDLAYEGMIQARDELGVNFVFVEPEDIAEFEEHQRAFADLGFGLVICVGFLQEAALDEVARDYPDTKFAIVDSVVDLPNVASLLFKEQEGSFLVGMMAALMTETNRVGFVGGMQVPVIGKFQSGYEQGVAFANPDVEVLISYAGSFGDPGRGKELAVSQHNRGADIIFHAAGASGIGVIDAAEENNFFAIGVDADQDHIAPGYVLTSMLKRVNVAVFNVIYDYVNGQFTAGINEFGIAEDGVGMSELRFTRDLIPDEVIAAIEEAKQKIADGELLVTDPTL